MKAVNANMGIKINSKRANNLIPRDKVNNRDTIPKAKETKANLFVCFFKFVFEFIKPTLQSLHHTYEIINLKSK